MARFIGRTSIRRSPRSHQAKKYLNKGAPVLYIGSTDISNPASPEELLDCIIKLVEEKFNKTIDTKIFINSQDYLRVVSSNAGRIIFCVPVDVIVKCINANHKYIAFSASTSLNPNSNTIHMAHVFECASERQVEDLYDALQRTIEHVHNQAGLRDDMSKVAPQFLQHSVAKPSLPTSSFVTYHSTFQPESTGREQREKKLIVTNHAAFRNAFEFMKQGNQEKLLATVTSSELSVLSADDAGQTLLHLSVRLDKFSIGKFLITQCCSSNTERENLRHAKDKEGMTALHIAALYGLKSFVKFLATDYKAVNIKDIKGRIPLHYCAGKIMHREITHILVDHGSQIEAPELDGIKPISIEPALQKIQELSVSGAFIFINNLSFLDRVGKRIDSGVDIACSEKTNSEPAIVTGGTSVHSSDSCYSPRQDISLSSIPEQDKLRPPQCNSFSSSHDEETLSCAAENSPTSYSDKMCHLREELSRLINLLNNSECHKYLLPQVSHDKTAGKLVIIAQYPLLTDDCANGIAFILHQLFKHNGVTSMNQCVEHGLLKVLILLLDSHVTIQTQAISILEEILGYSFGDKDYIAQFAELDPELILTLLQDNDLPIINTKSKTEVYAKRLRSLSSPSDLGDSLKNGNSCFTKNWSRRLLIRILSRTSYTVKMRAKLRNNKISKQLVDLMICPTMEIREHAVITLANMALSYDNHEILLRYDIVKKIKEQVIPDSVSVSNGTAYHATRALVYLGETDLPLYLFHSVKGIDEDIVWSEHKKYSHVFVKAATLEDIIRILSNDPKLLWGNMNLRVSSASHQPEHPTTVDEREIIRFTLSLHQTFADTMIFFRLLLHRFSDPSVSPAKRHKADIPPVHAKVCNVLCVWMEEFPWHFVEEPDMFSELEKFVMMLEDYGPAYYDIRDQIELKCQTVQLRDTGHTLDKVTHLDQYKHCRASLMKEEFPLSINMVSWLSALRGVIERSSAPRSPPGFIRSFLNFKERELTSHVKALIPPSYRAHTEVLALTKNLYENLETLNLGKREWQHLFVEAYFGHPLYKTELFHELYLQDEDTKIPVLVGVNEHHLVIVNRHNNFNEIIGHHCLTSLQKPIQWYAKPFDNVMCISMDRDYKIIGQSPSDIEMLATLIVQYMGGKIEIVDNMFYLEDEDGFSDTDHIMPNNRHSWHANSNGYTRLAGDCPPTTPCRNSYIDISQDDEDEARARILSTSRSRLSLNLSSAGYHATSQLESPLRRVHTANDVTMAETLKLVENIPRDSLTDRLRSFSTSIASKLNSVRHEEDSDEDNLPKVPPNDSLIGPPAKRPLRRSPRISPKTWERGVIKIDPETAQETVIITEKCNVLVQLKGSGASTPSTPSDSNFSHLRVRQMSSFKNIDTAAFTKLLTQSMEMIEERKRANRRNSTESTPSVPRSNTSAFPKQCRTITRSKTYSHTFDKLVAASTPDPAAAETPVELERFTCLRDDVSTGSVYRIRKAQDTIFNRKCDCSDVAHYTVCPCPPPTDLPYDFTFNYRRLEETKAKLLSYHREIARQLTLRDHALFANIAEIDLLEYTQKRDLPIADYPCIMECTEHFKKITNTVMTMILQCEPRDTRIQILQHFIDIAHQCVLLRNFSALFAIAFSALSSAAIRNLKHTWDGISEAHRDLFNQFVEITQPIHNYTIYRTLLQSSSEPTIPFLQTYIRDFLFINEGNPDYLKKGLINLQKRRLLYRGLEEIRYFQKQEYNLDEFPEVITFFMNYEGYDEEDFYLRSEVLKKSGSGKSRKTRRRGYS